MEEAGIRFSVGIPARTARMPPKAAQEFSDADRKRPGGLIKNRPVRTAESFRMPRIVHPFSSGGQRTGSSRLTLRGRQKRFAHSPMRSLTDPGAGSRNIPARAFRRPGGSGPSATGPRRLFPDKLSSPNGDSTGAG